MSEVAKRQGPPSLDDGDWDEVADVVVVGFGGAGAAAAIEASDNGAKVMVLDRFGGGGATRISGGVVYFGGGTELQREAGYDDTPDNMYQYLRNEVASTVSDEALRAFCDRSVDTFHWLQSFGVPFPFAFERDKTSYPQNETTLYFSGNETSPPHKDAAAPAPRGHRAIGTGLTGHVLFAGLHRAVSERPIQVRPYTRCTDIIRGPDGSVLGVEVQEITSAAARGLCWLGAQGATYLGAMSRLGLKLPATAVELVEGRFGRRRRIRARGGVVLAAGGFIYNTEMADHHLPHTSGTMRLGTMADDGSGIELGRRAGGAVGKMDRSAIWLFFNPPQGFLRGILIGRDGKRICNEELYGATLAMGIVHEHDGRAVLLIDHEIWKGVRRELVETHGAHFQRLTGWVNLFLNRKKAHSLAELERLCDMPAGALERGLADYHEGVATGQDAQGKSTRFLQRLDTPPYYAIDCDISNPRFLMPAMSLGGLKTDGVTARVLRDDGQPIAGLYAAGRSAVGVCSHSYVTGLAVADCLFSGRNAGRHAAAQAASEEA